VTRRWFVVPASAGLRALSALAALGSLTGSSAQEAPPPPIVTLQVALDRNGFGVGPIDGVDGPRTQGALADYAQRVGLDPADAAARLAAEVPEPLRTVRVEAADLAAVGTAPEDWLEASASPAMAFTSLAECLAERYHASPRCLERLNPGWTSSAPAEGLALRVPDVTAVAPPGPAALLEIDCAAFRLRAYGEGGELLASFPCSTALDVTRIPTGELRVVSFAPNPIYVFDPANFPESARAQAIGRKLIIPAGPNNPVGVYWMTLSRPGFGLHGTSKPETIGRPESHGCFRLTNWDIVTLAALVRAGTPVRIVGVP
jgi:lipoprotein-anchoring transpeptidase ErfK/SrfK